MATCPSCREHYSDATATCEKDGSTLVPDAVVAAADSELKAGDQVGEYRIEAKIGEGGFGAVYRAVHPVIGKTAAVKLLHRQFSSNPQMVSRFIAEAKAVNQIRHKNIIDIFAFGALQDGRQYYVMELLEGMTFDRYIKQRGRLPVEEALPILRGVGRALDAAHAGGIVHRDLKPENVFIQFDEEGTPTPKLLDFGIAKLLGESSDQSHKTRTGTPMGTPYYMSPEQAFGRAIDHRSDIYSFGIMTNEALTGRVVFDGESIMDVLFKHVNLPPPRMSERCPEIPASLDEPVLRMLAKDPAGRPATVMEALDELSRAANDAGFNVPAPVRGGIPPARVSDRGVVVTPAGSTTGPTGIAITPSGGVAGTLAQAQTLVGSDPTLAGASADIAPRKGRRTLMIVGMVAGAVAIAAVGFELGRPSSTGPAEHRPQVGVTAVPVPTNTALVTPAGTPPPPPAVTPSGSSDVGPEAAEVEIQIEATPVPVDVYRGADKIGSSASPLKLKRGEKVKLTFRAPGYLPTDVEVSPTKSALLPVKLTKLPANGKPASEVQW